MVYNLTPPTWIGESFVRAFCERITQTDTRVVLVDSILVEDGWRCKKRQDVKAEVVTKTQDLLQDYEILLLPVNFEEHWCGIIVDNKEKKILYMDSLNRPAYRTALGSLAGRINKHLDCFHVLYLPTPLQFDGFSCGLFTCMSFWRYVDPLRRYEAVYFVLRAERPNERFMVCTCSIHVLHASIQCKLVVCCIFCS